MDGKLLNPGYLTSSQVRVLHLENQNPVNWYWERHATVKKTSMYGSELEAAETAKEQVMNARNGMREWGVPISVPHRVIGGTGIKFFEFASKQILLDVVSKHCGPLDEWPYVKPFAVRRGSTSVVPDKGG